MGFKCSLNEWVGGAIIVTGLIVGIVGATAKEWDTNATGPNGTLLAIGGGVGFLGIVVAAWDSVHSKIGSYYQKAKNRTDSTAAAKNGSIPSTAKLVDLQSGEMENSDEMEKI